LIARLRVVRPMSAPARQALMHTGDFLPASINSTKPAPSSIDVKGICSNWSHGMEHRASIALALASLTILSAACPAEPAPPGDDLSCTAANHCQMVDGAAGCEPGYSWLNPDGASNDYRCVAAHDPDCACNIDTACQPDCPCDPVAAVLGIGCRRVGTRYPARQRRPCRRRSPAGHQLAGHQHRFRRRPA